MKAKDTVMNDESVINELGKSCYPRPKYWDEIDLVRKAQAEISFKAGFEEGRKGMPVEFEPEEDEDTFVDPKEGK